MTDETQTSRDASELRVPLAEEHLTVEKREVATGRVRVSTAVETFEQIARAELTSETVEVFRIPVGKPVNGALPQVRQEGDLTIVPIFEEVLVVEKRLMLKEELHLRKRVSAEVVETPVTLRAQTATVEHVEEDRVVPPS